MVVRPAVMEVKALDEVVRTSAAELRETAVVLKAPSV